MMNNQEKNSYTFSIVGIFLFSLILFFHLYSFSDIFLHNYFTEAYIHREKALPANFLYYWLTAVISFFNVEWIKGASITLLATFVVLKLILTYSYLIQGIKDLHKNRIAIIVLSLLLLFAFSIFLPQLIFKRAYIGSFPPNVWHNSTTISVMPFAILLFWLTINQIKSFSWKRLLLILLLVIINASIKPSYLFVYVGALPFTFILTQKLSYKTFYQLIPSAFALLLVFVLKTLIFDNSGNASIEIKPMLVYSYFHKSLNTPFLILYFSLSLITSFAFPIYVIFKKGIKRNDIDLIFSTVSIVGALFIYILLTETGERWWHGNFAWQIVISSYILFLVTAKKVHLELTSPIRRLAPNKYQIIFGLHITFGLLYVLKLFLFQSYL
jgi:hypothetical protein